MKQKALNQNVGTVTELWLSFAQNSSCSSSLFGIQKLLLLLFVILFTCGGGGGSCLCWVWVFWSVLLWVLGCFFSSPRCKAGDHLPH